jgi:hypothetical protein
MHVYMINRGEITFSVHPTALDEQAVLRSYLGTIG